MINEIQNFINEEENKKLLSYFDLELVNFSATNTTNYLTAEGLFVSPKDDSFLQTLLDKVLTIVNKDWRYVDYVNFMKYDVNGKFKSHYDFIDTSTTANLDDLKNGGQREQTFLIYLNDECEGGETHFPILNKSITLEKNKLVYWWNILLDGSQNLLVKHESKKIKKGSKYVVGIWVRQQIVYGEKTLL